MSTAVFFIFFFFLLFNSFGCHGGPIKTVVVLVMENRSFDHMLGWMKKINPDINGVDGTEWNPLSTTDPTSQKLFFKNQAQFVDPDPGQEQIFGSNDTSADPPPIEWIRSTSLLHQYVSERYEWIRPRNGRRLQVSCLGIRRL
ncbi:hypothetical protein GQ457_10G007050 [Hibiscus cannabinus]